MKSITSQIPNIITLLNLFSGCVASIYAFQGDFFWAGLFVCLGVFFDFFDGLFARLLNVSSELGLQLDSLADLVTSGFVPGLVLFQLLGQSINPEFSVLNFDFFSTDSVALIGFLVSLASAYRLANFNIDTEQREDFIGLPTPGNALLVISSAITIQEVEISYAVELLIGLTLISSYLLNARLRLFSFKFKNFSFSKNWFRFLMIALSIVALILFQIKAIPLIIVSYIMLSIWVFSRSKT